MPFFQVDYFECLSRAKDKGILMFNAWCQYNICTLLADWYYHTFWRNYKIDVYVLSSFGGHIYTVWWSVTMTLNRIYMVVEFRVSPRWALHEIGLLLGPIHNNYNNIISNMPPWIQGERIEIFFFFWFFIKMFMW